MLHELLSSVLMKKYYIRHLTPTQHLLLIFLNCGPPAFHGKKLPPLLSADSQAAREKIAVDT